jgi:hypothetical protein
MAHTQKPDFVFWRNGQVHLNWRGCQLSRLLAAEVCVSAFVMLHTPCSPSLPLPCITVCHHVSTGLYTQPRTVDRGYPPACDGTRQGIITLQDSTTCYTGPSPSYNKCSRKQIQNLVCGMSAVSLSQVHQNSRSIYNTYTRTKTNSDAVSDEHRVHFHQEIYITGKLY